MCEIKSKTNRGLFCDKIRIKNYPLPTFSILSCLKQMCPHILMKPLSIKKSICKVQDLREIINRVKSLKGEFKNLLFKLTKLGSK